jgi:LytS/YehU family sensor histidine kinase
MPSQGGVGMINIRQRLNLIYGNDYTLNIHETADTYEVELNIPLNNKKAE